MNKQIKKMLLLLLVALLVVSIFAFAACDFFGGKKNTKTVSFDVNGGDRELDDKEFTVGKAMSGLPTPTRSGYEFTGWQDAQGNDYTEASLMPDENLSLIAQWNPITEQKRTVSFNVNGGDRELDDKEFVVGKVMSALPTPTRSGYSFVVWQDAMGTEYTAASVMPDEDLTLIAQWEKVLASYSDDYISLKPATEGYKSDDIYLVYHGEVDKFVYVEITSDDLGGVDYVGENNNFRLNSLEGMSYSLKSGYRWDWYQGSFSNPNGAQRFTLNYGSNIQFVSVTDGGGVVAQTYLLDIYVKHDYYASLYESIFDTEPAKTVRVVENERFTLGNEIETPFEFDEWVYYNAELGSFEKYILSTAVRGNFSLYQTYKPYEIEVGLVGGKLEDEKVTVTPYKQNEELPVPEKTGYDFIGWLSAGNYMTDINGNTGLNYISKKTLTLVADYRDKQFYYHVENETDNSGNILQTTWFVEETHPVVEYYNDNKTSIKRIDYMTEDSVAAINKNNLKKYGSDAISVSDVTAGVTLGMSFVSLKKDGVTVDATSFSISFEGASVHVANYERDSAMDNFEFTATATECTITGVKDRTVTEVAIPNYVTKIGQNAFEEMYNLMSVTIPAGVTEIENNAFTKCYCLVEVFNLSELEITAGSSDNGGAGVYALSVRAEQGESNLVKTDDGFVFYKKQDGNLLVRYLGNKADVTLPQDFQDENYAINKHAFRFCNSLTNVVIDGVTDIGNYAFADCENIERVEISPKVSKVGDSAFNGCASLASVKICEGVTSIGERAFANCGNLAEVDIPQGMESIGRYAFNNCSSLASITIPFVGARADGTGDTNFGYIFGASSYSSNGSYVPESLKTVTITQGTKINQEAFRGCDNITEVILPDGLKTIGRYAFQECSSLEKIDIPESVTYIDSMAFYKCAGLTKFAMPAKCAWSYGILADCKNLEELTVTMENGFLQLFLIRSTAHDVAHNYVPESLKTVEIVGSWQIGSETFFKCSNITKVTIGDEVTSINQSAFSGCSSLEEVVIGNGVTDIGKSAFGGCPLTKLTIGSSVKIIGQDAFVSCSKLTKVEIPESVETIDAYAFQFCEALTEITLSSSLTKIGAGAFGSCSSLTSITIPASVTTIGAYAFYYCNKLTKVEFENSSGWRTVNDYNGALYEYLSEWAVSSPSTAAQYLKSTYGTYEWRRS